MQWGKFFGWGIAIYAIMYVTVAALSLYMASAMLSRVLALIVLIALATIAGLSLRRHTVRDILPYSGMWMAEVAILDAIMSVPYAGWGLYLDWNVWVGYSLVLLAPLLTVYAHRHSLTRRDV